MIHIINNYSFIYFLEWPKGISTIYDYKKMINKVPRQPKIDLHHWWFLIQTILDLHWIHMQWKMTSIADGWQKIICAIDDFHYLFIYLFSLGDKKMISIDVHGFNQKWYGWGPWLFFIWEIEKDSCCPNGRLKMILSFLVF